MCERDNIFERILIRTACRLPSSAVERLNNREMYYYTVQRRRTMRSPRTGRHSRVCVRLRNNIRITDRKTVCRGLPFAARRACHVEPT